MRSGGLAVALVVLAFGAALVGGCARQAQKEPEEVVIAEFPVENAAGLVDTIDVMYDGSFSTDANGSLRMTTREPRTFTLYELGDLDLESVQLNYEAKVRSLDVEGEAFIEMVCVFPGRGEFFSRALQDAISGIRHWTLQQTPFFLKEGENPSNIKLNMVINGSGTVWVDDIRVTASPLPEEQ